MSRKSFFLGLVAGTLLGTLLTLVVGRAFAPAPTPPQIKLVPVSSVAESAVDPEMPPNSSRHSFNGRPYYIVLLDGQ